MQERERVDEHAPGRSHAAQHVEDVLKRRRLREELDGRDASRALERDRQEDGEAPPLKEGEDRDPEDEGLRDRDASHERRQRDARQPSDRRHAGERGDDPAAWADGDHRDAHDQRRSGAAA